MIGTFITIRELLDGNPIILADGDKEIRPDIYFDYTLMNPLFVVKIKSKTYIMSVNKVYLSNLIYLSKNSEKVSDKVLNSLCFCYIINYNKIKNKISFDELCHRYSNTMEELPMGNEIKLVSISGEKEAYSNDDLYDITSWGADLSFRELISMYNDGDLLKPELQRKYVWTKKEASRFIDSLLLGLPVPSIFLAKDQDEKLLIIDGFQRIMTVYDYINGIFSGDKRAFSLSRSEEINPKWRNKTFAELTPSEQRKIRQTTIHAIIFEQKHPKNNTGMYQIFERINTTGRVLKPQEIRNCVYQGSFNTLLFDVNKNSYWRLILGLPEEDARMSDLELILRFFAMRDLHNRKERELTKINLAQYLNDYMGEYRTLSKTQYKKWQQLFNTTIENIYSTLETVAFKNASFEYDGDDVDIKFSTKINPAIYDAVMVATDYVGQTHGYHSCLNTNVGKYVSLLKNPEFMLSIKERTTDVVNIRKRINLACECLYGVEYEW